MKYQLIFNGRNALVKSGWRKRKAGFFKTVRVEADSLEEAEVKGVDLLRQDDDLNKLIRNAPDDPPMLYLDAWQELDADATLDYPGGATWYEKE